MHPLSLTFMAALPGRPLEYPHWNLNCCTKSTLMVNHHGSYGDRVLGTIPSENVRRTQGKGEAIRERKEIEELINEK